jgi:murein L,D-transpeptidase YafK
MKRRAWMLVGVAVFVVLTGVLLKVTHYWSAVEGLFEGKKTVAQRVARYGPAARERLRPGFEKSGIAYPPAALTLVGIKDAKRLEVYANHPQRGWQFVKSYPILAASGQIGPKLRGGDRQVPEGIYAIESLNPNSRFHLALRVGYPNVFDREKAKLDGREKLGGDIMIHGSDASVGCLAMGDEAAEELFVLAADVGIEKVKVILTPMDFRTAKIAMNEKDPNWTEELYKRIEQELKQMPREVVAVTK